jgi:nitrite reductase (NADH) small subunit
VTAIGIDHWTPVCHTDRLTAERGVAALIDGVQIALFRTHVGALYAVGNIDPFTGSAVLSRGIVGSRGSVSTVASPLHKQVFDLTTGRCLDDAETSVPVYRVRLNGDQIEVFL